VALRDPWRSRGAESPVSATFSGDTGPHGAGLSPAPSQSGDDAPEHGGGSPTGRSGIRCPLEPVVVVGSRSSGGPSPISSARHISLGHGRGSLLPSLPLGPARMEEASAQTPALTLNVPREAPGEAEG
jgi:hypothetical protein